MIVILSKAKDLLLLLLLLLLLHSPLLLPGVQLPILKLRKHEDGTGYALNKGGRGFNPGKCPSRRT
jgi:hypothetical protein